MAYSTPPTLSAVDDVIYTDWNTYIRDNFTEVEARKMTDYVAVTSNTSITATTAAASNTIITATPFTPNGTDAYLIEFQAPQVTLTGNAGGNACIFHLYEDSTNIGRIAYLGSAGTTTLDAPVTGHRRLIPTNASHTYSVRAHRTNANCTVVAASGGADTTFPVTLRVTRLP